MSDLEKRARELLAAEINGTADAGSIRCGGLGANKTVSTDAALRAIIAALSVGEGDGVRGALQSALEFAVLFLAFDGRDRDTPRMDGTLNSLNELAVKLDAQLRAAIASMPAPEALTPSTPGTREEGLEEAARVAEDVELRVPLAPGLADGASLARHAIVAAIRALKQTDPTGREG